MFCAFLQLNDTVELLPPETEVDARTLEPLLGSLASVAGFKRQAMGYRNSYQLAPGIYEDHQTPLLRGARSSEKIPVQWQHIKPLMKTELAKREQAWRAQHPGEMYPLYQKVSELPNTPFWEDDRVTVTRILHNHTIHQEYATVMSISYPLDTVHTQPVYHLSYDNGGSTDCDDTVLTLRERGNLWKYYHGHPVSCSSAQDEAAFYASIHQTVPVRNHLTDSYEWTREQAIKAVQAGIADSFYSPFDITGHSKYVEVIACENRIIGTQLAIRTMREYTF